MAKITIERLEALSPKDLMELGDATEATMLDTYGFTIGFKQWQPPLRHELDAYFRGVMMVPDRRLFVARIDGTIAGSIQLLFAPATSAAFFSASIDNHFVAPWARNFGIAKKLLECAENYARTQNTKLIKLSVRSNLEAAVSLYERSKYKRWGVLRKYEMVGKQYVSGYFYCKGL